MALHVFRHVEAGQLDAQRGSQLPRDLRLADARRTAEQIAADGLLAIAQTRARQLDGGRERVERLLLTIDDAAQGFLEMLKHLRVVLRHGLGRNARHRRDGRLDFLDADGLLAPALGHEHL